MKNSEMLDKLYKILRMNIILAKSSGEIVTEDTYQSFEDTAKKLDDKNNDKYENEIKELYYETKTLQEETARLERLIGFIDKRINERKTLTNDYYEVTGKELEPLSYIKDEDKLETYKERQNNINTYLSNEENISKIEEELIELNTSLDKNFDNKNKDEENNEKLESELLSAFKTALIKNDYSYIIDSKDIDLDLEKIKPEVEEQLKTLKTFNNAYSNLLRAGINRSEQEEYSNYVMEAKKNYYEVKEKDLLYNIYKQLNESKTVYDELQNKRDELDNILEERLRTRIEMSITNEDILDNVYNIIDKQKKCIDDEKTILDNISDIEEIISFKEARLSELKEDNQRVEILELLREYGIIETYEVPQNNTVELDNDIEIDNNKEIDNNEELDKDTEIQEEIEKEENEENEEKNQENTEENIDVSIPNMIIEIKEAYPSLNINFAKSKADTVMRRVGRSLGCTPETKKENIVSFDFYGDKEKSKQNESKENIVNETNNIQENEKLQPPVNNSLSSLNVNDLNLNLKLDSSQPDDEKLGENVINNELNNNSNITPIFPEVGASNNNTEEKKENNIDANIDTDFWSAEEDKEIFPSVLKENEVSINKEESGFKLGSPINIGGSDENRN